MTRLILILLSSLLSACAASGGSSPSAAGHNVSPASPQTKEMTLYHGLGYICWVSDDLTQLWCWSSETAVIDANMTQLGVVVTPAVFATAPAGHHIEGVHNYDHAICYVQDGSGTEECVVGNPASGTANSYQETNTCDVISADSVSCPHEDNPDLTFAGLTLASAEPPKDIRDKHYPHSPTYLTVRATA